MNFPNFPIEFIKYIYFEIFNFVNLFYLKKKVQNNYY